jgi:hypothetical protein
MGSNGWGAQRGLCSEEVETIINFGVRKAIYESVLYPNVAAQQSLAADGAMACFPSDSILHSLETDRSPDLKATLRRPINHRDSERLRFLEGVP